MRWEHLMLLVCLIFYGESKPLFSPAKSIGVIESTGRALEEVPLLDLQGTEVLKAIQAEKLLVITDYHGTMIEKRSNHFEDLRKVFEFLDPEMKLVVLSRSAEKEIWDEFSNIKSLEIYGENGLRTAIEEPGFHPETGERISGVPLDEFREKIARQTREIKDIHQASIRDLEKEVGRTVVAVSAQEDDPGLITVQGTLFSLLGVSKDQKSKPWIERLEEIVKSKIEGSELKDNWKIGLDEQHVLLSYMPAKYNKGTFAANYLQEKKFDYVISLGDSDTEAQLHEYINSKNYLSIHVDPIEKIPMKTTAKYRVGSVKEARDLLTHIAASRKCKP